MEVSNLELDEDSLDELQGFGTWYFCLNDESSDIINALFRYGFCLVQISLSVAKSIIHNGTLENEAPWTPDIGLSSTIVSALLDILGMPAENRFILELHSLSSLPWFCAHATKHDETSSIIPAPKSAIGSDVYHQCCISNQCIMAQANRRLLHSLDLKVKQREMRILRARTEAMQQQNIEQHQHEQRQQQRQQQFKNEMKNGKQQENQNKPKTENKNSNLSHHQRHPIYDVTPHVLIWFILFIFVKEYLSQNGSLP